MRRLRRYDGFEVEIRISSDAFIRPPREAQRNWLVNRALNEFADDLRHLDAAARTYVAGGEHAGLADRASASLRDEEIMEDWQIPVMKAMAEMASSSPGAVLEIGFGRGVSADFIQETGPRSHTIVECNPGVIERFHAWRQMHPDADIRLIEGRWQDCIERFEDYDGIFFHTYPLDEDEYAETVVRSITFAEPFFPVAAAHLRHGGMFTYLTNEADSLSRSHQRLLLRHFREFRMHVVGPLALPEDSRDDLWADTMVVVGAVK